MEQKPTFIYRDRVIAEESYVEWLHEVKTRYRQSQVKAAVRVNTAMLEFYWSMGRDIVDMQAESKWGSGFFNQLSLDMKAEFPNEKGFSAANLRYMKRWYNFYYQRVINLQRPVEDLQEERGQKLVDLMQRQQETKPLEGKVEIRQRVVEELEMPQHFGMIPWGQHIEIFTKCKSLDEALFYVSKTIENNWSRPEVEAQIADRLFQNQGAAVSNFSDRLPAPQGDLAQELVKGEYNLDFLGLRKKHDEKELEDKIATNVTRFLLELGKGFLFEARQKRFTFEERNFYVDLVLYNRLLQSYVLVDLKIDDLTHQDLGQMQMYVNYYDRYVKEDFEHPTIGILLCKEKNDALVELTLPKDANIYAAAYQLYLPDKALLQAKVKEWIDEFEESEKEQED